MATRSLIASTMNPKRRKTMTAEQLKTIEAELQKRGYKKWTTALTSSEDWAWFKSFDKEKDEDGYVVNSYQIAFRVWDGSKYPGCPKEHPYGFDFWTSALGADSRMNFESNWEPIADIPTFERLAAEFETMIRRFVKTEDR